MKSMKIFNVSLCGIGLNLAHHSVMNQPTRFLVSMFAIGFLSACGSSKSGSKATSSSSTQGASHALAECNVINGTAAGVTGYLSSYYVSQTQSYRDDLSRVYLTGVPTEILTTDNRYLQILPWRVNETNGQKIYDRGGLGLIFIYKTTGEYLNANSPVNTLSKSSITQFISDYSLSTRGVTLNNFFSHMIIIVTGLTTSDDALSFSLYDTANTTSAIASADVLLTAFYANPYYYNQTHSQSVLQNIHPLVGMSSGLAESDYLAATNIYCQGFL